MLAEGAEPEMNPTAGKLSDVFGFSFFAFDDDLIVNNVFDIRICFEFPLFSGTKIVVLDLKSK